MTQIKPTLQKKINQKYFIIFSLVVIALLLILLFYLMTIGKHAIKNPLQNAAESLGDNGQGVFCSCDVPVQNGVIKVYFNKDNYSFENPLVSAI